MKKTLLLLVVLIVFTGCDSDPVDSVFLNVPYYQWERYGYWR
jgi:hypothetical protein